MKNTIKKIAAIAMAFTLLGTGTAITKSINPESVNIGITANAACSHSNPRVTTTTKELSASPTGNTEWRGWHKYSEYVVAYETYTKCTCNSCGKLLYQKDRIYTCIEWR
jgi:hypothetical protein